MLNHLKALTALSGVSGDEGAVRDYILDVCGKYADVSVDALGNVIVHKKGLRDSEKTVMLSAHMDEVGFIITNVTDEGYLRFDALGAIDRRVVVGKRVLIGKDGIPGIIGMKPVHLASKDEQGRVPEFPALYMDIGVSSKEAALALVSLGDTAVFDAPSFEMGTSLAARAIDDRVGCAVLLALIERELPIDLCFVFTVQEEIGLRGAQAATYIVKPDICFNLEGTTAADLPGVAADKQVCRLGGGVVIPFMDKGTVYDRGLYAAVTALAEQHDIPWQTKTVVAGGTDAAVIQRAGGGVRVLGLAIPVRNLHTGYNVADLGDIESLFALICTLIDAFESLFAPLSADVESCV